MDRRLSESFRGVEGEIEYPSGTKATRFCDASDVAVGSALCQTTGEKKKDQHVAYTSKQLIPA